MRVVHACRRWRGFGAVLGGLAAFGLSAAPAHAQKVYVGIADQWTELLNNPSKWTYVRQHADGFYLNFIMMEPTRHSDGQALLTQTAALFTHKNAFFESDYKLDGQNEANDNRDIDMLQAAGFTIPYTSLNTGWDVPRYRNLKTYHLLPHQPPRDSFVQNGPWTIDGDIKGNVSTGGLFPNAQYRQWFDQADGNTTDGPLGYWSYGPDGFNKMKTGSYSLVRYAHAQGKLAMVMLCPYGAGISTYDAKTMFVQVGKDCVHGHEDNDAEPEVYAIFEYATTIGAVPEAVSGAPAPNSTTAMAYYLLKHLHGDPGTLHLSARAAAPSGKTRHYVLTIADTSPWLDYAAVLKAARAGAPGDWNIRYVLKERDITRAVFGAGFKFYRGDRINPAAKTLVDVYVTPTARHKSALRLKTSLLPHHSQPAMAAVLITVPR